MSGKAVFGGVLMLALGLAGGWFLRERSVVEEPAAAERVEIVKEMVKEVKVPQPEAVRAAKSSMQLYFEEWAATESLAGAALGFCVLDEKGELVFASPLAGTAMCPASALKTVTAGAAFGLLGPEFRFETTLLTTTTGDLVLRGGGDPTLSEEDLLALADDAVKKGLKRVEGTLKVDAAVFPEAAVSDHWVWGDLGNAYGAGAFGLNVGHNVMVMAFDGGAKEGDPAKFLGANPGLKGVEWDVQVTTGPQDSGDRVMIYSSPYAKRIEARGSVPMGAKGFTVRGAVPDPPKLAGDILRVALERRGVVFGGRKMTGQPEKVIAVHRSAPLPEIVDHMQLVSDNLEAQSFFLMMGAKADADPVEVLRSHWEKAGVSFAGLRLIDGSGLARATMIRPVDLAMVNLKARQGAQGKAFFETLPANRDGSMRSKRGAMSGVRTEVGFVKRGEKEYTFALMANGLGGDVDFWRLREGLLDQIGR
ncbi:MAG TPA: D-alanyl-D-alanine carboxypeptidase/D-alanyl-D-alanine-endopeptidase [Luteolibacter sp.]|nr:D-alanyl-D-alanine carboxypeptidase/D-alanyl-D-alanine-endopeptidase [Luteolibacter sp.]